MVHLRAVGVAWFRREDYQRIREISDDEMHPTFEQFEAKMAERLPRHEAPGIILEKVIVDPDELLAFARDRYHGSGRPRVTVRPCYAGLPIARLDAGRMNGGESCRDRGTRKASPSGHGRTAPQPKIAAVERREARRPALLAGDPWRSRDRP